MIQSHEEIPRLHLRALASGHVTATPTLTVLYGAAAEETSRADGYRDSFTIAAQVSGVYRFKKKTKKKRAAIAIKIVEMPLLKSYSDRNTG